MSVSSTLMKLVTSVSHLSYVLDTQCQLMPLLNTIGAFEGGSQCESRLSLWKVDFCETWVQAELGRCLLFSHHQGALGSGDMTLLLTPAAHVCAGLGGSGGHGQALVSEVLSRCGSPAPPCNFMVVASSMWYFGGILAVGFQGDAMSPAVPRSPEAGEGGSDLPPSEAPQHR